MKKTVLIFISFIMFLLVVLVIFSVNAENTAATANSSQNSESENAYIKGIQRRIQRNWQPLLNIPENKLIVVKFKVARNGMLLDAKISKSSGIKEFDDTALEAIKISAPFRPLPQEWQFDSQEIEFTFDYNSAGENSNTSIEAKLK